MTRLAQIDSIMIIGSSSKSPQSLLASSQNTLLLQRLQNTLLLQHLRSI